MLLPSGLPKRSCQLMAFLLGYFDESGKFKDKHLVSFCGFAASPENWEGFHTEWAYALRHNGLKTFKSSEVFRHRRRLSPRVSALGVAARIEVIKQFVTVIRENVEIGIASTVDARAFRELTSEEQRHLRDPHYLAFRLTLFDLHDYLKSNPADQVALICDDEELYSVECYKIFTRLRRSRDDFRMRFVSISFADDSWFTQLQAADLLAGISRYEAARKFLGQSYEFEEIIRELNRKAPSNKIQRLYGHFLNQENLKEAAKNVADKLRPKKARH